MCMFFHVAPSNQRIKQNSIPTPYSSSASPPNNAELAKVGLARASVLPRKVPSLRAAHLALKRRFPDAQLTHTPICPCPRTDHALRNHCARCDDRSGPSPPKRYRNRSAPDIAECHDTHPHAASNAPLTYLPH